MLHVDQSVVNLLLLDLYMVCLHHVQGCTTILQWIVGL